ncbi:MAG: hypothetical protein A2017_20135 [Lentisphaerae bacterium GWF2_44_16]|nr:MAG: hypothetical protein A2017_20135 [Lentisphaerae bacterium GWF2_44_16]
MKERSFNNDCNQLLKKISRLVESQDLSSDKFFQEFNGFIDKLEDDRYQTFSFDENRNALFIISSDDLKVIWNNNAGTRMLGIAPDKVSSQSFDSFLNGESKNKFKDAVRKLKDTGTVCREEFNLLKNGRHSFKVKASLENITGRGASQILISLAPGKNENPKKLNPEELIRKMELEIKERKNFEKILNETNNQLKTIVNSINGYIVLIDKDFKILDISENLLSLYNIPDKASVLGKKCYDAFKCRKIPCRSCPVPETLSARTQLSRITTSHQGPLAERTFKVSTSPIKDKDGNIWAVLSSVIDVTELKETQDVLLKVRNDLETRVKKYNIELNTIKKDLTRKINEKNLLSAAIEQAAEGILITNANGTIQYSNPAYEKITGYNLDELKGKLAEIFGKNEKKANGKIIGALATDKIWNGLLKKKKKDNADLEVEVTVSPIYDAQDEISNYIIIEHDVTEKSKLERQLTQSQKMEAIGTLAGGIAHDFNNILMALTANAEMALECTVEDAEKLYVERIIKGANRAKDLVRQILTFSRQSEAKHQPLQVHYVIKEALKLIRATMPSSIEIHQDIDTAAGMVIADPGEIHQIIMNLCSNASHAMKNQNGVLSVSVKNTTIDSYSSMKFKNVKAGEYVELAVSDTGHGIEKNIIDRVFDPFFTTKKVGEGTGLGLSVVHGIIRGLKGEIIVESTPGKGASFKIYIPRLDQVFVNEEIKNPRLPSGNGERLLFVDDEEALVEVVKDMLVSLNYKVTATVNGNDALKIFSADPEKFALAIIDQTMPGINGSKLFIEIKNIRNDIPVILCTGYSDSINSELALKMGIEMFLIKPVSRKDMASAINKLIKKF